MTRPASTPALLACALIGALLFSPLGTAAQPSVDQQEAALAYAQCMRENGFAEFPDPSPDGHLQMRVNAQSAPRFRAAQQACEHLAPAGWAADRSPEQMEALLDMSRCMRENGIVGFPDPDPAGHFDPRVLADAGINPQSSAFEAAMSTCRDAVGNVPMRIGG